jgi:chaperone protein EcpD
MMSMHLVISRIRASSFVPAIFIALTCFAAGPAAIAGIVVDGTRVVYPATKREVTVTIHNPGDAPSLVQAWLDAGDPQSKPGDSKVPFVLTPPLFRLDPTKVQSLRLVYTHDPLPQDRESLYWLNVLDIPPRAAANPDRPNQLDLAFKHRMKVFFRPTRLTGSAGDAPAKVTWQLLFKDGKLAGIKANNPTAYHVSLTQVGATVAGHLITTAADMVDPFASRSFDLQEPATAPGGTAAVEYWFINDYGGSVHGTASASSAP